MEKILKGIIIGIAYVIPGVSGSSMAIILGVYDEILQISQHVFKPLRLLKNYQTLLGIIIGLVIAILILQALYQVYPWELTAFFIGIVSVGAVNYAFKMPGKGLNLKGLLYSLIGVTIIILLDFIVPNLAISTTNLILVGFSFFIAAGSMMLPGVSGSLVLMVFGTYFLTLDYASSIMNCLASFAMPDFYLIKYIIVAILAFLLGMLISGFFLSRWKNKYPIAFHFCSLGLVWGSLVILISESLHAYNDLVTILRHGGIMLIGVLFMIAIISFTKSE